MIEPRTLKGFRDYGPKEQLARQQMFAKIQSVFERFGFLPLSTPVLEYKEILMGKYGDDEKLVYSFKDNGDRDVAMRYDLTVPMARYVAQNQNELSLPFKRYQIAPVWRAENTQKGRLREFYQCDVDIVGTESPLADAEVMACLCKTLEELQIKDYKLCFNDRRVFDIFQDTSDNITEIIRAIDKLNKIGKESVIELLKGKGISELAIEQSKKLLELGIGQEAVQNLEPKLGKGVADYIGPIVQSLINLTSGFGVEKDKIVFDPSIVRGLDYYTSTVFEIVLSDAPEFGSIAGGGRYDGLVDTFSEKSLPAVGGSIGIDRLFEALESKGLIQSTPAIKALVINQDETLEQDYVALVSNLRNSGINSEVYYEPAKLDKQFKYAESKGIPFAVVMGKDEKEKGVVQVKNMQTREQVEVRQEELMEYFSK